MFGIDPSNLSPKKFVALNVLYQCLPRTFGCDQCETVNQDNAYWCCRSNSPSMHYVEFLHVWNYVQEKWSQEEKIDVILRSIKNYLLNGYDKGCVFWDKKCTVYDKRPLACRMYGVLSDEAWNSRVDSCKDKYGSDYIPKPQCSLVKTKSAHKVTKQEDDLWFSKIRKLELSIGVPKHNVNEHDDVEGSYRTFHDYVLLSSFQETFLEQLTQIKLQNNTVENIDKLLVVLKEQLLGRNV